MQPEGAPNELLNLLSLIDLTSLGGTDTQVSTVSLCRQALHFGELGLPLPAAICVFSPFVKTACRELEGSGIRAATVAGGFPHGQVPGHVRLEEVKYAIDQGADEIDIVFSRGIFLSGNHSMIRDEISAIREICQSRVLKVILETGELRTAENIAVASGLALEAGADFIKTSTGKIPEGATPEAIQTMAEQIRAHHDATGRKAGIKPSGGISTPEAALELYRIVGAILGSEWLNPQLFRIGASKLAGRLAEKILGS